MKENKSSLSPVTNSTVKTPGQKPLTVVSIIWVFILVFAWAINTIIVKIVVRDIPPLFAAFFRFGPATLIMLIFLCIKKISFKITLREFGLVSILGIISAFQIFTFTAGAQFTTGGRVTLFIYTYPFLVAFIAPLFIRGERFSIRIITGCTIALSGVGVTLYARLSGGGFKGDIIEILSALFLAFRVVVNKRFMQRINKWKVLIYTLMISTILYFAGGFLFEKVDLSGVKWDAWVALVSQILFTTCFTFLSWQYLLSKHSAAKLSAFFFASPIIGMICGIILLGESFDPGLIAGCILVGAGILLVQLRKR